MSDGGKVIVAPLVEGEDFYMDHGLMVLTSRYHLRRGYCCEQGCRHCPYKELEKRSKDAEDIETIR